MRSAFVAALFLLVATASIPTSQAASCSLEPDAQDPAANVAEALAYGKCGSNRVGNMLPGQEDYYWIFETKLGIEYDGALPSRVYAYEDHNLNGQKDADEPYVVRPYDVPDVPSSLQVHVQYERGVPTSACPYDDVNRNGNRDSNEPCIVRKVRVPS